MSGETIVTKLLLIVLVISICGTALGITANPLPIEKTQPDGSKIKLKIRGDERFHWFEDTKGYPVIRKNKEFFYAQPDSAGRFIATGHKVGKVNPAALGLTKNIRPVKDTPALFERKIPPAKANSINGPALLPPGESGPSGAPARVPAAGTVKNLVILCKFSDHVIGTHTRPPADYDVLFNNVGTDPLAPTGSVRDFYYENSYSQMTLNSTIIGWVDLPQTEAYYANGEDGGGAYPTNAQKMVEDALEAADPLVDFSQFDNDSDGYIDSIDIIHSGYGAEFDLDPDKIWSHMWALPNDWVSDEGVKVYEYHTEPALWGDSGTDITRIGVIVHETGHFFGLPDLYDTDFSSSGIGNWGAMANAWGWNYDQLNPSHFCGWSKIFLDWVTPVIIDTPGIYTANRVEDNTDIFRIDIGYPDTNEYLLIENRQPFGFESPIPQGGLAIWHIDETKGTFFENNVNDEEGYPGQPGWPTNNSHYRVALLQADGDYDLEHSSGDGDAFDLYHADGVSVIGSSTVPNTDSYKDGVIVVNDNTIYDVNTSSDSMTFRFNYQQVTVPNVVGELLVDAETIIDSAGLTVGEITYDYSDTVPADEVIDQDPSGGTLVPLLSAVDLVVSLGPFTCFKDTALDFDGIDDYVDCGNGENLDGMAEVTLSAWVYLTAWDKFYARRIISKLHYPQSAYELTMGASSDTRAHVGFYGDEGSAVVHSHVDSVALNQWYHVATTNTGTEQRIYINGVEEGSNNINTGKIRNVPINLCIGQISDAYVDAAFEGTIDEVAIWNRALDANEIKDVYCNGVTIEPNLVGYWDFSEGGGQFAFDKSGYGNDGQLGSTSGIDSSDPNWVDSNVPFPMVYYVDEDAHYDPCEGIPGETIGDVNSDPNEDGSECHPFDSIQKAVDATLAADYDCNCIPKIVVLDGLYTGTGNYDIDPNGLAVTIKSENGPQDCIIDYEDHNQAFIIQSGEDANTVIDGFTITNRYTNSYGTGLFLDGSSPIIRNCTITGNHSQLSGAGIWLEDNSNPLISYCTITNNSTDVAAGGIYSYYSSPTITNCIIAHNYGYWSGAVTCEGGTSTTSIINCTIADNWADDGPGGLESYDSGNFTILNSILWNNIGGQIYQGSGTITVQYSDVQMPDSNAWPGIGNITQDPLFGNQRYDDYHLQSAAGRWQPPFKLRADFDEDNTVDFNDLRIFAQLWLESGQYIFADLNHDNFVDFEDFAELGLDWRKFGNEFGQWIIDEYSSPCIDAGDPNSDYSLEPDPNGGRINMGVYGNTTEASKSPTP